jgi:hypothetical protein
MNDLFTILIILAFIISFLNKIFGKKKQQQTTRRQPVPGQRPKEWIPPWFEPGETEVKLPEVREEDLDIVEETEYKQPSFERQEQKKVTQKPTTFSEMKIFQEKSETIYQPEMMPSKAFNIELSSQEELKRGIVLAEILGPCRARKRLKRI